MGGAQHENSVDRKYMDVSAVKVYDVVLSRSMTIKTNTKIMKLRISIASPARLFFSVFASRRCAATLLYVYFQRLVAPPSSPKEKINVTYCSEKSHASITVLGSGVGGG